MDQQQTVQAVNRLQELMTSQKYFMSLLRAQQYAKASIQTGRNFDETIRDMLYAGSFERNLDERAGLTPQQRASIKTEVARNDFIKMLFHDWSLDPMYFSQADRVVQIQSAQNYCLQLLLRGQASTEVMQIFLKKSALAYDIRQMIFD